MPEFNPEIIVLPDARAVAAHAATVLIDQVAQKSDSVLTLPTGGTPLGVYKGMVKAYADGAVDFANVTVLNLDEYWPISPDHPASYAKYMSINFFNHVNVPPENRHIPNGQAPDADKEAERYGQLVDRYAVDLGCVSIGPAETCHIAFNERGSLIDSRVRYVPLVEQTKEANLQYFESPDDMPEGAITQGVADILSAERILFIATGAQKAWGVWRSMTGEISSDAPASFLRHHPNVSVVLDRHAASLLG